MSKTYNHLAAYSLSDLIDSRQYIFAFVGLFHDLLTQVCTKKREEKQRKLFISALMCNFVYIS